MIPEFREEEVNLNKELLLEAIYDSFSCTSKPVEPAVSRACYDWEDKEVLRLLANASWKELNINIIDDCKVDLTALVFRLSNRHFLYFLPAFMSLCLSHYDEIDILSDSLFRVLALDIIDKDDYACVFAQLNLDQKKTIAMFLQFFEKNSEYSLEVEAQLALKNYWGKFC